MAETLLKSADAAKVLSCSKAFLERDRWAAKQAGTSPQIPFVRIGSKIIRYRLSDLEVVMAGK